jgi:hypothetical protein
MNLPVNYEKLHYKKRRLVREEYIRRQENRCWHCKANLYGNPNIETLTMPVNEALFPPNFFKYPIHLHHDHNTGMTIGAVHAHCNAVLWQYYNE